MEKKKGFVSAFIDGAKNGYQICMTSTLPNVMFAFILIRLILVSSYNFDSRINGFCRLNNQ